MSIHLPVPHNTRHCRPGVNHQTFKVMADVTTTKESVYTGRGFSYNGQRIGFQEHMFDCKYLNIKKKLFYGFLKSKVFSE